jgi:hypothetical protein
LGRVVVWMYRAPGAGLAIGIMELLARVAQEPFARVPFVTSIVMALSLPDSEPAQPYAIIVGHLASCIAGFLAVWCLGSGETARAKSRRRRVGGIVTSPCATARNVIRLTLARRARRPIISVEARSGGSR